MNTLDDYDFRVPGLELTLGNVCTTFCMRNGVKRVLKRRNILSAREIAHNVLQNRRMITILEFCACFDAGKAMHYFLHAKWSEKFVKRRNILSGREITQNFLKNRRMLTILEILCLFLR